MPNCNSNSALSSRRSSRASNNSYTMMHVGSGIKSAASSRRESVASSRRSSGPSRPGSRRESLLMSSPMPINYQGSYPSWPEASSLNTMHESLASLRLKCDNVGNERGSISSPSTPPTIPEQEQPSSSGANNLFHTIGSGVVGSSSNFYYYSTAFYRTRYRKSRTPFQIPKYR